VSIEERLESGLPSAWRPDQDDPDLLVGVVQEIEIGTSDYGQYPIIVVRSDAGEEKAVHAFHTVLQNELKRNQPQIGERIGIKYLGDVETKPGSKFKSFKGYRVKVERDQNVAFDWNKLGQIATDDQVQNAFNNGVYEEAVAVPEGAGDDDVPF